MLLRKGIGPFDDSGVLVTLGVVMRDFVVLQK